MVGKNDGGPKTSQEPVDKKMIGGPKTDQIGREKMMGPNTGQIVDKNDGGPKTSQIGREKVMGFLRKQDNNFVDKWSIKNNRRSMTGQIDDKKMTGA